MLKALLLPLLIFGALATPVEAGEPAAAPDKEAVSLLGRELTRPATPAPRFPTTATC